MKSYKIILMLLLILGLGSCDNFLEVDPPKNELMAGDAFKDETTATATILGVYAQMNSFNYQFSNMLVNLVLGMSSDDMYAMMASYDDFRYNNLGPSTMYLSQFWDEPYSYIYQTNSIIAGLQSADNLSPEVRDQLLGEAHFLRGFSYFYLFNLFGEVPLVRDVDVQKNSMLPKADAAEIQEFLIQELLLARDLLQDNYSSEGRVRPNKKAASALLARIYLYQEDWQKAKEAATEVIEDTRYQLIDLDGVFLKDSEEAIWQLQTVNTSTAGVNTWEGFTVVPAVEGGVTFYLLTEALLNSFEPGDKRASTWIRSFGVPNSSGGTTTYHYPFKYTYRTVTPVQEYSMVMRLAEQYLIRAEANAQLGDVDAAMLDVNAIRERADLDLLENRSQIEVLEDIAAERQHELFTEWGHRWFDLIRTGKALEVLAPIKEGFTQEDFLFPIPLTATLSNPNL